MIAAERNRRYNESGHGIKMRRVYAERYRRCARNLKILTPADIPDDFISSEDSHRVFAQLLTDPGWYQALREDIHSDYMKNIVRFLDYLEQKVGILRLYRYSSMLYFMFRTSPSIRNASSSSLHSSPLQSTTQRRLSLVRILRHLARYL